MSKSCKKCNKRSQDSGYIYIVKEPEFINNGENIYKVCNAKNMKSIRQCHPKNTELCYLIYVNKSDDIEKTTIKKFDELFEKTTYNNKEYYRGRLFDMVETVNDIVHNNRSITTNITNI